MGPSSDSARGDFVIEVIDDYATGGAEETPKSPRKISEASTLVGPDDDHYPLRKPSATFSASTSSAASNASNNFSRRTPCPPYCHPNSSTSSSVRFANVDYNTQRSAPRQTPQWPLHTPRRSRPTPIYGEKQYYLNLEDDERPQRPMIKAKSTGDLITPELAAKGRDGRPPRTFKSVIVKSGGSDTEALYSPIVEFIAVRTPAWPLSMQFCQHLFSFRASILRICSQLRHIATQDTNAKTASANTDSRYS